MARKSSVISVLITGDNRGLSNALDDSSSRLSNFGRNAGIALAAVGAAVTAAAATIGRQAVNAASDLTESINAVNVAYGDAAKAVLALGETSATAMGVSRTEFNAAAVRFSAFAERVVGESGDVAEFISDISVRAADFASVFNIDVAEALQVFQSGLSGEAEPLKRFGINLLDSEVKAYALRTGLIAVGDVMTEQQKVQARYGLLMESTAKTAGDFANTSDGLANSQRILKARLDDTLASLGEALLPVATALVGVVADRLVPAFEKFSNWFRANSDTITAFGERVLGGIETAVGFIGDKFAEWRPKIGEAVDFVREKSDEFRTFFAERIQGPVDTALERIQTFATEVKTSLSGMVSDLEPSLQGFLDFFRNLNFDDPEELGRELGTALGQAVKTGLEALGNLSSELSATFGRLVGDVDWYELGKRTVSQLAVFALGFAAAVLNFEWFEPVLKAVRENLGEVLLAAAGFALAPAKIVGRVADILRRIPIVGRILAWFVQTLNNLGKPFREAIDTFFTGVFNAFMRAIRGGGPAITTTFREFLMRFPAAVRNIGDDLVLRATYAVERLVAALGTSIRNAAIRVGQFLRELMTPFANFGRMLRDDLFSLGRNLMNALADGIRNAASAVYRAIRTVARTVWEDISSFWQIRSPSRLFMDVGENAMAGLAAGIRDAERMVSGATATVALNAIPSVDMLAGGAGAGQTVVNVTVTSADPEAVVEAIRRYTRMNGPLSQVVTV